MSAWDLVERRAWLLPTVAVGAFVLLTWLEMRRPLRPMPPGRLAKARRVARNLATGALAALPAATQPLLLAPVLAWGERERIGLLHRLELATWVEVAAAVLLLDLTLWVWHRLNHTVPFLWRFHLAHHADRNMDASTALRFHFGEMALSIPWRGAQVALIGSSLTALSAWSGMIVISILFHHSNLRLPLSVERRLVWLVVTPRMHGIHHSTVRAERNANYASLLTAWDACFGTLLLGVPQRDVEIGVPPLGRSGPETLRQITLLPFGREARAGLADAPGPPRLAGPRRRLEA